MKSALDTEVQITSKGEETQCSHSSKTQCVKSLLPCHTAPKPTLMQLHSHMLNDPRYTYIPVFMINWIWEGNNDRVQYSRC